MTGYHHFSSPLIRLQKITKRNTRIHHTALPINFPSKTNTPIPDKRRRTSQYSNIHSSKPNNGTLNYVREMRLRSHNSSYNNGNLAYTRNKITAGMTTQRVWLQQKTRKCKVIHEKQNYRKGWKHLLNRSCIRNLTFSNIHIQIQNKKH
jgi:hypothetical protein